MTVQSPDIWVLKGARAGDTAQALDLARRLSTRVTLKPLSFNVLHMLPNALSGISLRSLTGEARAQLAAPWPDLVIATGKRTAPAALWVKAQSPGHTRAVQLGRPRMDLSLFDLVITTPQYGLPQAPNVITTALPFASRTSAVEADMEAFTRLWSHLPRPWHVGVVGGAKFPLALGAAELAAFGRALNRLASASGGSVILIDSPRSGADALALVAAELDVPQWRFVRGEGPNPYQAALALGDVFAVTGDSVSMVGDMLGSAQPTYIFRLPVSPLMLRWTAQRGVAADLARRGWLVPPRNVPALMEDLLKQGYVGDLATQRPPHASFDPEAHHAVTVQKIRQMLKL